MNTLYQKQFHNTNKCSSFGLFILSNYSFMHSSHSASNKRSTHCPKKYAQLKQCDETIIKHISFCYYQFIIYKPKDGTKIRSQSSGIFEL